MDAHSILIVSCFLDSFTWSSRHTWYCLYIIQLKTAKKVLFDHTRRYSSIKVSHITKKVYYFHSFDSTLFVQTSSIVRLYTFLRLLFLFPSKKKKISLWKKWYIRTLYSVWKCCQCFLSNLNHNGISVKVYTGHYLHAFYNFYLFIYLCVSIGLYLVGKRATRWRDTVAKAIDAVGNTFFSFFYFLFLSIYFVAIYIFICVFAFQKEKKNELNTLLVWNVCMWHENVLTRTVMQLQIFYIFLSKYVR